MTTQTTVTRELVPEDQRLYITEKLFGVHFPLQLEPVIYGITERMAEDYDGGYWDFWTLSNGGFYMTPSEDRIFHVKCHNCMKVISRPTRWGSRPVCTLTATCLSPTATSPGSMHVTIIGCGST